MCYYCMFASVLVIAQGKWVCWVQLSYIMELEHEHLLWEPVNFKELHVFAAFGGYCCS